MARAANATSCAPQTVCERTGLRWVRPLRASGPRVRVRGSAAARAAAAGMRPSRTRARARAGDGAIRRPLTRACGSPDGPPFGAPERVDSWTSTQARPRRAPSSSSTSRCRSKVTATGARAAAPKAVTVMPTSARSRTLAARSGWNRWYRISPRPCAVGHRLAVVVVHARAGSGRRVAGTHPAASAGRVQADAWPDDAPHAPTIALAERRRYSWSFCRRSSSISDCARALRQPGAPTPQSASSGSHPTNSCSRSRPPRSRASHVTSRSEGVEPY